MALSAAQFRFLGPAHLTTLALTAAVPIGLAALASKAASGRLTRAIAWLIGAALVVNEVVRWIYGLATVDLHEFLSGFLPLHICGAAIFLTAVALVTRNRTAYETAYFWGIAGTLQAVITPTVKAGFPSYEFMRYFIAHSGIITGVLFATWAMKMRPTPRSIARTIVITHVFAAFVAAADVLLDANYMFLRRAADAPTFFFFLPWPWYIVFLDFVGIAFFILLYLPFPFADMLRRFKAARTARDLT
ncbi:MAG: YwaF family protein [Planctomycetota bacterium]|jgi:hypothetical integral membrane protein (TIGR02206 family)